MTTDHSAQRTLYGIGGSEGVRIGQAFLYQPLQMTEEDLGVIASADVDAEIERLRKAKAASFQELSGIIEGATEKLGEEKANILRAQQAFLDDPSFFPPIENLVTEKNYSASKAVQEITDYFAATFEAMENEYFKERASDVRDLGRRLMTQLQGKKSVQLSEIKEQVILIAEDLSPSDTVQLDKKYVLGFATSLGGKTSHTAILARSLGVPAVLGVGQELEQIQHGDLLILDGATGSCLVNPSEELVEVYRQKQKKEAEETELLRELSPQPAETKDGLRFELAANIGTPEEVANAYEHGAEGIGLYRTEFLFMQSKQMPTEEEQFMAYRKAAEDMQGRPVIIRTLDIGGDKKLPYLSLPKEMNPFLGYRAIRLCLDQQDIFKTQLRAILRASTYGRIKIMFPMISSLEEWRAAKSIYTHVQEELKNEGLPLDESMEVGMMVEIPSVAVVADQFAPEVDFFSIGTNDLVQYTLAVDRMNEKIAHLYDYFHPAIIQLIKQVIDAAHRADKWVGMCGGMAGDPLATPLLAGLGLDEWSMDVHSINKVKRRLSQLTTEECQGITNKILQLGTTEEIRKVIEQ